MFHVFFPVSAPNSDDYEWTPSKARTLKLEGYAVKHKANAATIGVKLFSKKRKNLFELKLLPGMKAEIDGKSYLFNKQKKIEITEGTKGVIYGNDGWTLEFYYYKGEYASYLSPSPITPFLAQAYLFAIFFWAV